MSNLKSYEKEIKEKIKNLGKLLGFEIEEEWTPSTLKEKSREEFYIPRIDIVWFKKCNPKFVKLLSNFNGASLKFVHRNKFSGVITVLYA